MASPRVLLEWCRVTCAPYPAVEINNMSSSFRDGLAFCAIIHKHRPDLVDFSSLCKDNVFQNNKLAFEVAETRLGIPALLDPKDMASTKVPDCLGVITYLSQYYYFFSGKSCGESSPAKLWSSHVTVLNNLTRSKTSDGLKRLKSLTDVETGEDDQFSRRRAVCNLCYKPVHLIQRHLVDGKVYHHSCFRCTLCHSSLLPESYTQGKDPGSLICTYHVTDGSSTRVSLAQQADKTDNKPEARYWSLDGLAVSSVPHYAKETESQDRPDCKTFETARTERQDRSGENRGSSVGPPRPPQPSVKERAFQEADNKDKRQPGASESAGRPPVVTEERSRPVPAPRRTMESSVAPVPAPRVKTSQSMNSFTSAGSSPSRCKSPPSSSHVQTVTSPKVQTSHPWMTIVHPGPWTQLPPAPPPIPPPRSKSVLSRQAPWNQRRTPPPNPFEEEEEEEEEEENASPPQSADQTDPLVSAVHSEKALVCQSNYTNPPHEEKKQNKPDLLKKPDFTDVAGVAAADPVKRQTAVETSSELPGSSSETDLSDVTEAEAAAAAAAAAGISSSSEAAESHILPRSLSVPAISSDDSPSVTVCLTDRQSATSCQSKPVCKENPFDRKPAMTTSKTLQDLSSSRGPAPGHGFPLIRRKVQTDQYVSSEELEVEMRMLNKRVEALEQRGMELERNLRDCRNDKEEEQMLMEWFSLVHERHILLRKDTELVYQTKQQKLEDRQADVEYDLRCLLNKPESDWTQEDRSQEQQLMDELVAIIEHRNQIVSSLEQDRQRERKEDMLLEDKLKNKDLQKERLKELKKPKGKFKPIKVFKLLTHK